MADIFDEVEEGLREDRYRQLFLRYGPLAGAAIAAVLLGVGGWEVLSSMRERATTRSSDAFFAAQDFLMEGDFDAAAAAYAEVAETGSGSYPVLALMQQAAAEAEMGDPLAAARLYDEAAARASDPVLKASAQLSAAYLFADTLSVDELEARLEPLMQPGEPYELLARELLGAAALQAGDYERARSAYNYIPVALGAPPGVQQRASQALAAIDAAEAALENEDN